MFIFGMPYPPMTKAHPWFHICIIFFNTFRTPKMMTAIIVICSVIDKPFDTLS